MQPTTKPQTVPTPSSSPSNGQTSAPKPTQPAPLPLDSELLGQVGGGVAGPARGW